MNNFLPLDDITVIDNVVSIAYQDAIKKTLLEDVYFPWYFNKDVTNIANDTETNYNVPSMSHNLISDNGNSPFYDFFLPLVLEAGSKKDIIPNTILRARSFLQFPINDKRKYNHPHCDMDYDHTVILYYVNDSDGDTFIFDQTLNDFPQSQMLIRDFTIKKKISPKQGRAVIFNGKRYHASSTPSDDIRCILNFDIN